ncbi:MAG: dolichyl-phosphate-mannose--protein mannosyltransferase [Actinomycetota bacterium]
MADLEERPEETTTPDPPRTWGTWDWIAVAVVTLIGGALRLVRLSVPDRIVFDETYYAKDACWFVNTSEQLCEISAEQSNVHPPLGKWLIAIGIRIFGYDSFGWRVAAAAAGTLTIVVLYLLARKLLRSTLAATLASGLLAFDLLHFVQSRISMLDIFVPLFGTAAILFAVYDRDRFRPDLHLTTEPDDARDVPIGNGLLDRPWRLAAGASAGAAAACKWSGLFYLALVFVLVITWELAARRADGRQYVFRRAFLQEAGSIVVWLVILPVVIYVVTYIGRLEGDFLSLTAPDSWWKALWDRHKYMFDFHINLKSHHSYESPGWSWMLLKRPVSYYFDGETNAEIFAAGSPFVWWASILAFLYVIFRWIRNTYLSLTTKGGVGSFLRPEGVIVAGYLFTYGPWLLPSERPAVFLFYLLPTIPFMCLALAYVAAEIGRSWEAKAAVALFAAGTMGLFAFYYPLTAAVGIPKDDWDRRIWIFDKCDKPPGIPTEKTITETIGRRTRTRTQETTSDESLPPTGWCWI